ncbi:MAG: hypothetical protein AAF740_04900 [Bacteroidota bacterium]
MNIFFRLFYFLTFIGLLTACGEQRLHETWISLDDGRSTITFTEGGQAIYNQVVKKEYEFVKDNMIEISSTAAKEQFEISYGGDTLILTGIESRTKYLPPSYFERKETVKETVLREATQGLEKLLRVESFTSITFLKAKENITLNTVLLKDIKPETKLHRIKMSGAEGFEIEVVARVIKNKYDLPEIIWRETVESALARNVKGRLRVQPTKIKLVPSGKNEFEGVVDFGNGRSMDITLDLAKGWMPKRSLKDMNVYTEFQIEAVIGVNEVDTVILETEDNYYYTGTATTENGKTLQIKTDPLKGWSLKSSEESAITFASYLLPSMTNSEPESVSVVESSPPTYTLAVRVEGKDYNFLVDTEMRLLYPANEIAPIAQVIKKQINARSEDMRATNVSLRRIDETHYEGEVEFSVGIVHKLKAEYLSKGFRWEIVRPEAKGETKL